MAKDRLADLINKAQGNRTQTRLNIQDETQPLTNKTNLKDTFERSELLREWIESIENNIEAIRDHVKNLDKINIDQKDLNIKIETYFQNNTSISHRIQASLKRFDQEIQDTDVTSAEGRIKNIQFTTLKTRYQKAFKQNTAELENYQRVKKSQLESQLRAKGVKVTDEQLTQLLDDGTDIQVFADNILATTAEEKRILQDLEDRHQQLVKIERMLEEVRDLFLQMSILIDNQQDLVDRVEYQAGMAVQFVERGREDLREGNKKKNKFLKRKIILILIIVVLLAVILALILK